MSDLFGTPIGEIARGTENRNAMLGGLQAQKLMGEIAAQPAEAEYKQSLGRLHAAEAADKEATAAAQQQLLGLQKAWLTAEDGARQTLVQAARAGGTEATVADLKGGSAQAALRPVSQAESLRKFAEFAEAKGMPPLALAGLHKQIADIEQSEAQAAFRNAQAGDYADKQKKTAREQVGGLAAAAAADPKSYAAILMNPQTRALLPKQLTGSYATDAPVLRAIAQASMTANEQEDNARLAREAASKAAARGSANSARAANVKLSEVKLKTAEEVLANLKKYGGPTAEATLDLKRSTSEARRAVALAKEIKAFPPMPLDHTTVEVGGHYTANGKRWSVIGRDAAGKPILLPFEEGRASALKAAQAIINTPADADLDEED